ncbi:DoxX family protein [Domibacillus enclensis]|uniref:Oxidoreductase n=1 Tax=Domibacillus enclensis TaxID=1017273 RepID=A0A1N7A891_9BACI|nr:DoxX family protein [Domibacillus enclensis]OXS75735.1 oxidoreductase [Domibacillus enclensis]SIR35268.1 Uncharacterized membrane protein YphA, DoxX/SURF4 family [Domibacillus enclensis]
MNRYTEWSAFILRLVLGITFFVHGVVKFQGGIANTAGWFDSIGLPGMLAYAVAFIETAGGLALILGIGTRVFSAILALVMVGAIFKVKLAAGFIGNGQSAGYELDLALLAMSASLALTGSSFLALDQFFSKEDHETIKRSA